MALDAYSLCPGGTGKKIKFCCGDFLSELQKIDRMMEGEQYLACLQAIDRLLAHESNRDRACLLAIKGMVLRITGQPEAAEAHAAAFLARHPNNEIALAESAILTSPNDARASLGMLQKSFEAANGAISPRTYEAMGLVAAALLDESYWLAGRALLQLQVAISDRHDEPVEMLLRFNRVGDVPLLLRDDPPLQPCEDDAPWRERFAAAMESVQLGDWATAANRMAALAADVPDSSVIWRDVATLRGWLADHDGCIEALRKYVAIRARDEHGLEDAVEAEATAMLLSQDPLGDQLDMLHIHWIVRDVEKLQEALLSSPRLLQLPFDPAQFTAEDAPPPKTVCVVLDRPMPETSDGIGIEHMPRLLGQAVFFGRQTDREARLEVIGVAADELQAVKDFLAGLAAESLEPQSTDKVAGHWSASQKMLRTAWPPSNVILQEQLTDLLAQHRKDALLTRWPNAKLGVLGGRSPREVANDASYRVRLLAAIMVLEFWSERMPGEFDFNRLRGCLGLPVLGPIDPRQHPVADLPLVRLARLSLDGLSDDDLILAYRRAAAFAIRPAVRKFALAIIERASLNGRAEQLMAYNSLARTAEDPNQAIEYVNQGRLAAESAGKSSASWDLLELSLRFARREGHEAIRLVEHIQAKHLEEPGVGEALTHMLIDVGLLRPDGTPAYGPGARHPVPADEPASEPTKLWTPDAEQSGGGGKLWTPE